MSLSLSEKVEDILKQPIISNFELRGSVFLGNADIVGFRKQILAAVAEAVEGMPLAKFQLRQHHWVADTDYWEVAVLNERAHIVNEFRKEGKP